MNLWHGRRSAGVLACCLWFAAAAEAASQSASTPIDCWWRTDQHAVYVGEPFGLTLTCGVMDTADARVTIEAERLDPAALDLAPFEVVSSIRHEEIEAPPWRYLQYSYTLRLLGDAYFGQDVDIPSIAITYAMESSGATGTRGQEHLYLLPALPLRVLSLVPQTAADIRDWWPETFGDIERRRSRAVAALAAAGVLLVAAAFLAGLTLVHLARPRLVRAAAAPGVLPPAVVLRSCLRETARVKAETERSGWSADLIVRALTVLRIGAALALGQPLAQTVADDGATPQEGQLRIRRGTVRVRRLLISGSATAGTLAARLAGENGSRMDPGLRTTIEELNESLRVLTAARYARDDDLQASALDGAIETGARALRRLYVTGQWPARAGRLLSRAAARLRGPEWFR